MTLVIFVNGIKGKKKRKFFKNIIQLFCYCKYFLFYFIFNFLCVNYTAFNIDTKHPQIHRKVNTGFGYSVEFAYTNEKRDKYTLLVGAPFAQTSQHGLKNAGAVYGCEIDQSSCAEIFFDRKFGNEHRLNGSYLLPIEEKSNQMFGATIISSKNGDSVLACAPHYKYFFSKFEVVEPVGRCFYAQNYFSKITEFAPCRQEPARHGHHRFGYGMCGFSASIPGFGNDRLFISAPGVWYWQGALFSQSVENITDRLNTVDGPAYTDHYQLGYSSASGDFNGDKIDDVVVGVPRGNELIGMVSIYSDKLHSIANLTDSVNGQRGQYFGASVAVADLNKDGLADLIVGSPFYTDYKSVLDAKTQERKPQYDIGKIYVYIQAVPGIFKDSIFIVGYNQWSRFGQSVSSAGDLNGDGYEDIIVGAPFDGEDGRGSVYVYHGSEDGIRKQYTQKIEARDVHRDLRTFGFSIKGGKDIDKNDYPDIAIGAFQSSQAVILKSRPVIQIFGSVQTAKKTINLDEKLCITEFGRMACEKVNFCIKYNGKLKQEFNTANIKLKVRIDSKKTISPRAFILRKDLEKKRGLFTDFSRNQLDKFEQILTLTKGREVCETYNIFVPDTIRDKILPIVISVNYTYIQQENKGNNLEPAPDLTLPQSFETELVIEKDCGDDNVCIPNLKIYVETPSKNITVGADQTLTLNVSIENLGEDSYLTQYYITIPPGFEYSGLENYETKHKVSCSPSELNLKKTDESYVFVCDIGNPLQATERVDFGFKITGNNIDLTKEYVEIKMSVNSTNKEDSDHENDNKIVIHIPIEIKPQLYLTGRSNPDQVNYSIRNHTQGLSSVFDFEVGPIVSHLFQVRNRGPSLITGASLDIIWPSFSDDGKPLLYLIDMPYVNKPSNAKCRINQGQNVNSYSLAISGDHVAPPKEDEINVNQLTKENNHNEFEVFKKTKSQNNNFNEYKDNYIRNRRQATNDLTMLRKIHKQKQDLKKAVQKAKEAGAAADYHGKISRSSLNCYDLNCTYISCDFTNLAEDEFVLVEVFSRLWVNTLIDNSIFEADISSLAIAQITSLPHSLKYKPLPQIIAVTTDVNPTDSKQQETISWWLILLAIFIALFILLCIMLCCWRYGFFNRNRPHLEKAKLSKGSSLTAEAASKYNKPSNNDYFADESSRYTSQYSASKQGAKV